MLGSLPACLSFNHKVRLFPPPMLPATPAESMDAFELQESLDCFSPLLDRIHFLFVFRSLSLATNGLPCTLIRAFAAAFYHLCRSASTSTSSSTSTVVITSESFSTYERTLAEDERQEDHRGRS